MEELPSDTYPATLEGNLLPPTPKEFALLDSDKPLALMRFLTKVTMCDITNQGEIFLFVFYGYTLSIWKFPG